MFVVAGVSGNTGSVVANALLAQGKPVRVIVRDPAKGEPWKERGAEVAVAELGDAKALTAALAGAAGAYLLIPPQPKARDYVGEQKKVADAFADAVAASKIPHVVLLSSVGAQHEDGTGPIKGLHYAEQRLATKTDAKLTFVRAAYFLENWRAVVTAAKAGKLPTFLPPEQVIPQVATQDIGLVVARALAEGPPASRIDVIELAGAKDLSSKDVARLLAGVLHREVDAEAAPLDAVVPTFASFGFSTSVAEAYEEMYRGIASGKVTWEGSHARAMRGAVDPAALLQALASG